MRDKTHNEQIERWARYVKSNPDKWKFKLTPFLDSQIIMAKKFYAELLKTPNGKEKMRLLREKNSYLFLTLFRNCLYD